MKTKIITGIIVFFVVAIFAGNWIYGNKVAKEIDTQLKLKISQNELPVIIAYSAIKVNPLFSKVKIKTVSVTDVEKNASFNCKAIEIGISPKEALRLAESNTFEEINSLQLKFVEAVFKVPSSKQEVKVDYITADFDGHLTKTDFENINKTFPSLNQKLKLSFSNLNVNNPLPDNQQSMIVELQKQLYSIDKGSCTLIYFPDTKEIRVKDFSIASKVLTSSSDALIKFSGNGLSDFNPIFAKVNSDYTFKPEDMQFGRAGDGGILSLSKLSISSDLTVNIKEKSFPEGKISILVKGLKAEYPNGNGKPIISLPIIPGATIEKFDMKKLSFNYQMEDGKLTISDTQLKSSAIDATLEADVMFDKKNPKNSNINTAKLVINKLAPNLEKMVTNMERQTGKTLPRIDNIITLEFFGKLVSPKIKGLEL